MIKSKNRKGFSLLVAIFVILMLSLVASYIYYASSTIAKVGSTQYQKDQAELYARSYTEYAIMAIDSYNRSANNNCITQINQNIGNPDSGQGFKVKVLISYIGNNKYLPTSCPVTARLPDPSNPNNDTLMAIIDVYVSYKDSQHMDIASSPWITYHKRSLQKLWKERLV